MFLEPNSHVAAQTSEVRELVRDFIEMGSVVSSPVSSFYRRNAANLEIMNNLPASHPITSTHSSDGRYGYGPPYSMCACN
jgi:hypothetical protein